MPTLRKYLCTADPGNGPTNYPGYDGYFSHPVAYIGGVDNDLVGNDEAHILELAPDYENKIFTYSGNIDFRSFTTSADNTITIKPIEGFPFHNFQLNKAIQLHNYGTGWVKILFMQDRTIRIKDLAVIDMAQTGKADALDVANDEGNTGFISIENCIVKAGRYALVGQRYGTSKNCIFIVNDTGSLSSLAAIKCNKWGSRLINCLCLAPNVGVGIDVDNSGSGHLFINTFIGTMKGSSALDVRCTHNAASDGREYGGFGVTNVNLNDIFLAGSFANALDSGDFRLKSDPSNPLYGAGDGINGQHIGPELAYPVSVVGEINTDLVTASVTLQALQITTDVTPAQVIGDISTVVLQQNVVLQPGVVDTQVTPAQVTGDITTSIVAAQATISGLSVSTAVYVPGSGQGEATAGNRVEVVPERSRKHIVGLEYAGGVEMAFDNLLWRKLPGESLWFEIDWSRELGNEIILSSVWSGSGLTIEAQDQTQSSALVKLADGVTRNVYTITNTITTDQGQVMVYAKQLVVE